LVTIRGVVTYGTATALHAFVAYAFRASIGAVYTVFVVLAGGTAASGRLTREVIAYCATVGVSSALGIIPAYGTASSRTFEITTSWTCVSTLAHDNTRTTTIRPTTVRSPVTGCTVIVVAPQVGGLCWIAVAATFTLVDTYTESTGSAVTATVLGTTTTESAGRIHDFHTV